jgi:MFS family permease
MGAIRTGFWSLVLIYLFLLISNFFSGFIVSKFGAKKCLVFGPLFYSLFIFAIISKNIFLIYLASVLLGFGGSLLWTAQGCFLIRASNSNYYGKNAGFFNTLLQAGSFFGIIIFGFLAVNFSFNSVLLLFAFLPLIPVIIFATLKNVEPNEVNLKEDFSNFWKMLTNLSIVRLSLIWFSFSLVLAAVIGQIPLEIKKYFNLSSLGLIIPIFYLLPLVFSYYFGKKSDIKGWKNLLILSYALIVIGLSLFALQVNFELNKWFFILCFLLVSFGYAIFAPLSFSLRGRIAFEGKLEHFTAITLLFSNAGCVVFFLFNLYLPAMFSYLISFCLIFLSLTIALPVLKLTKNTLKEKIQ